MGKGKIYSNHNNLGIGNMKIYLFLLSATLVIFSFAGCGSNNQVNIAPVATPQSIILGENVSRIVVLIGTDADGDPITYEVVDMPSHGLLSGTAPNLTYTPNVDYLGSDSFTFKVKDAIADSATVVVDLSVKRYRILTLRHDSPHLVQGTTTFNYTYDSNGNMLTEKHDLSANDIINMIRTYIYDDSGNTLSVNTDYGKRNAFGISPNFSADGTIDYNTKYTYDSNGNMLTESYNKFDNNIDMENWIYNYTYDDNGNVLIKSFDYGIDGIIDTNDTYNSDGNILTSTNYKLDGSIENIDIYIYDVNGNLITESSDANGDGIVRIVNIYTYNENGNMLTKTELDQGGEITAIYTYTYNINGNMLTKSYLYSIDGITKRVYTIPTLMISTVIY